MQNLDVESLLSGKTKVGELASLKLLASILQ
jgi:hypothetical protein